MNEKEIKKITNHNQKDLSTFYTVYYMNLNG